MSNSKSWKNTRSRILGMKGAGNGDQERSDSSIKPSNNIRAAWAASCVEAFKLVTHAPALTSNQELVSDLLSDLMHLCHRNGIKLSFEAALTRAQTNFLAEVIKEQEGS